MASARAGLVRIEIETEQHEQDSPSGWPSVVRNVEDDDFGDDNVELEVTCSSKRSGHACIPTTAWDCVYVFRLNSGGLSAMDGDGDSSGRGSNGHWGSSLRKGPCIRSRTWNTTFAGAHCAGCDSRCGGRARDDGLKPLCALLVLLASAVDAITALDDVK